MATALSNFTNVPIQSIAALSSASTLIQGIPGLIVASPQNTRGYQPQNPFLSNGQPSAAAQPPSLLFHYEGENTATLTSEITDHFAEDNTANQDQIALKPIIVTVHGFVGELNDIPPPALRIAAESAGLLTTIGSYVPTLTTTALIAYNEAYLAYSLLQNASNAVVSAVSSLGGGSGESVIGSGGFVGQVVNNQNKQQTYFQQFYGYWQQRTLFTIQTPWAVFENMAILTLRAEQSEETRMITDFQVTFKQMNFASTLTSNGLGEQSQGRVSQQGAGVQSNGVGNTTPSITLPAGLNTILSSAGLSGGG